MAMTPIKIDCAIEKLSGDTKAVYGKNRKHQQKKHCIGQYEAP